MNQLLIKRDNEILKKKKKGFTLIELIIVIAIIAILAAIAIPKFGEMRGNANAKADLATAKNIHTAIAAEIASDNSTYTSDVKTPIEVESTLLSKLDGDTKPKVSGHSSFYYSISSGNIQIYYNDGKTKVYPADLTSTPS